MSTPAQIAANIANAQHSTGPRTAEGKARSAHNAASHGLTSRDVVVTEADRPEFEELQTSLYAELCPQGALETSIFQQLIHAAWNLARIRRLEAELWQIEPNLLLDEAASKAFDRLGRYHGRTERSYFRALKELKHLQSNRPVPAGLPATNPETAPAPTDLNSTKRTQSAARQLIDVISISENRRLFDPLAPPPSPNSPTKTS